TDAQGQILAEVSGVRTRPAEVAASERRDAQGVTDALYRREWLPAPLPTQSALPMGRWLVVRNEGDAVAEGLAEQLRGRRVECVAVEPLGIEDELPAANVVCFWKKNAHEEAAEAALQIANEGLVASQALARQTQASRLWWVTIGAVAMSGDERPAIELAPLM